MPIVVLSFILTTPLFDIDIGMVVLSFTHFCIHTKILIWQWLICLLLFTTSVYRYWYDNGCLYFTTSCIDIHRYWYINGCFVFHSLLDLYILYWYASGCFIFYSLLHQYIDTVLICKWLFCLLLYMYIDIDMSMVVLSFTSYCIHI